MAKINIKFNNKNYSIDNSLLADATARLEAHLTSMAGEVLEGDGAEYYTLAPTPLSFRSTAPLSELQEVTINGEVVDPSNYTLEEGSTIVTFPIEYLKTLDRGNYEVAVVSENKTVKGEFNVATPELNEYGFYYNQPYAAYMAYFNSDVVMFIRENNIMDIMVIANNATETAPYAFANGVLTITSPSMGTLHCTFSEDGMELYNVELGATLSLNENETYVADSDYIYIYNTEANGYVAQPIKKNKSYYAPIKTGITNIPTTAFNIDMFRDNTNLLTIPQTPDSVWGIASNAFWGCTNLPSAIIPDSIIAIGTNAFSGCTKLSSVVLPVSVQEIYSGIFYDCTSLTNIVFKGSVAQWNAINKAGDWLGLNVPATHVHCIDGDVAL